MYDQHRRTDPDPNPGPACALADDDDRPLWDAAVAALAAAGIDVVQAGDGRPGAVLQLGPRDLLVAVGWQPTDQQPLPGGVLGVNACSRTSHPVGARQVCNMILESHLAEAGLRTAYVDGHLVVVHPDLEIPGQPRRESTAAPAGLDRPAAPARASRRRGWPARWLLSRTGR